MTRKELFKTLIEIIEDVVFMIPDSYEITLSSKLEEDLKADQLDAIEIVMELEDEFDMDIPDRIAEKWKSVSDIYLYLDKNIKTKKYDIPIQNRFEILDL